MRKLIPDSQSTGSWRSICWNAILHECAILLRRCIIKSLSRSLVLVLELRKRAILSLHLLWVPLQFFPRISNGTHQVLAHEFQVDKVLEPMTLTFQRRDGHHTLAVFQYIGEDVIIKKASCSLVGRASGIGVGIESVNLLAGKLVDRLHNVSVCIRVGCHIGNQISCRSFHQLLIFCQILAARSSSLFSRFIVNSSNLASASIWRNIFLFYIFLFIIYIIIIISRCSKLI